MFFSKSLYKEGLKKIRVAAIGSAAVLIILNAAFAIAGTLGEFTFLTTGVITQINGGYILPLGCLLLPSAFILVLSEFSFLSRRNASDFFHALPQKRICVYVSFLASVLTCILAILALSLGINLLIWNLDEFDVDIFQAFSVFAGLAASSFVVAAITLFCRILAGTTVSTIFYTVSVMSGIRLILAEYAALVEKANSTIVISRSWLRFLTHEYSFLFPAYTAMENDIDLYDNPYLTVFLFVEAVILFVISAFLFQKRESETAEKYAKNRLAHNIFKIIFLTGFLLLFRDTPLFSLTNAVVLSFLFDLATMKTNRSFAKSVPQFFISLGIAVAVSVCSILTANAYITFFPKANKIESFSITKDEYKSDFSYDYPYIYRRDFIYTSYRNLETENENAINALVESFEKGFKDTIYLGKDHLYPISIKLKNGKEIFRYINFEEKELKTILSAIKETEENKNSFSLPKFSQIENSLFFYYSEKLPIENHVITEEIYEAFSKEYASLKTEEKVDAEYRDIFHTGLVFSFETSDRDFGFYLNHNSFPKTTNLIDKYYFNNCISGESWFSKNLKNLENEKYEKKEISLNLVCVNNQGTFNIRLDPNHPNYKSLLTLAREDKLLENPENGAVYYVTRTAVHSPSLDGKHYSNAFNERNFVFIPNNVLSVLKTFEE